MIRLAAVALIVLTAGCDRQAPAPAGDAAMAAAERKAVADTDAANRDAAARPVQRAEQN